MDWDSDWQTVRRRRRQRSEVDTAGAGRQQDFGAFQVLGTDALPAQDLPEAAQKKKRKRKKATQVSGPQPPPPADPSPSTPSSTAKPPHATAAPPPGTANTRQTPPRSATSAPTAHQRRSLFTWFWTLPYWLLPFLFKPPTPPHPKPQVPATPTQQLKGAAPGTTPAPAPTSAAAAPAATAQQASSSWDAPSPKSPSYNAAVSAPKPASPAQIATANADAPPPAQRDLPPLQQGARQQRVATPTNAAAPQPEAQQNKGAGTATAAGVVAATTATSTAKAAPQKKPQGSSYLLKQLPGSFDDVVGGIAIAGDVLACSSYDGNVQLFHLPATGAADPRLVRHLSGHTGRVCAVALEASSGRVVTAGHDALLKVWTTGADRASAKEASSQYLYEAVTCMAPDWGTGRTLLGGRSGAGLLWDLEAGRRIQVMKGHSDEVSAVARGGQGPYVVFTGAKDGTVRIWDTRQTPAATLATLSGFRGRVCSLAPCGDLLYAGDQSSTVKVFDLRSASCCAPARELPNAPVIAGEACPVTGLAVDAPGGRLLSSAAAWWSDDTEAMVEAPDDVEWPVAAVNLFRLGATQGEQYSETLRLGGMAPLSCMAVAEDGRVAGGDVLGGVALLWPGNTVADAGANAASRGGQWETSLARGVPLGVVELEECSSGSDEGESEGSSDDGEDRDEHYD